MMDKENVCTINNSTTLRFGCERQINCHTLMDELINGLDLILSTILEAVESFRLCINIIVFLAFLLYQVMPIKGLVSPVLPEAGRVFHSWCTIDPISVAYIP